MKSMLQNYLRLINPSMPTSLISGTARRTGFVVIMIVLAATLFRSARAFAQSGTLTWEEPINLSQSGGSLNPQIIANSERILLVVWDEDNPGASTNKSGYSILNGETWSDTVWAEFPFSDRPVQFIATENNRVHAFWVDMDGDLRHKLIPVGDFGNTSAWAGSVLLATSVVAFDAVIDPLGITHLSFITTTDTDLGPAGVYHLRTLPNVATWQTPALIYASGYYLQFEGMLGRSISPSDVYELPAIDIEAFGSDDTVSVMLSWSNPALKRVFMANSLDAGSTWEAYEQVDGPEEDNPYKTPSGLVATATAHETLRFWNRVQQGGNCTLTYQVSSDGGESWGEPVDLLIGLNQCPDGVHSLQMPDGDELFILNIGQQTYFLVWNGDQWSDPQLQQGLGFFTNPTTYGFVQLGCQDATLIGDRVFVAGCDLTGGGDIWLITAQLQDIDAWFQTEYRWQERAFLNVDSADVLSMSSAYDTEGNLHVLWSALDPENTDEVSSSIYYGGWNNGRLIGPFKIIQKLPGQVTNLSVALGPEEQISALWNGGQYGEIYYSSTSRQEAPSARGWMEPEMIVAPGTTATTSDIYVDKQGVATLVYAVPANEGKGLYILRSENAGLTWTQLSQMAITTGTECPMLEDPGILDTRDGSIHLIWTCSTLPGGIGPLSLNYSVYDEETSRWGKPVVVVEGHVTWSKLVSDGLGQVHLIWIESQASRTRTTHSVYDPVAGTWSNQHVVFTHLGHDQQTDLSVDRDGNLHIIQISTEDDRSALQHKSWNGLSWSTEDSYLPRLQGPATALQTQVTAEGDLVAIFMGTGEADSIEGPDERLVISQIGLRDGQDKGESASLEGLAQSVEPEPENQAPDSIQGEAQSADNSAITDRSADARPVSDASPNSYRGLIVGAVAALGLVVAILIQRLRTN